MKKVSCLLAADPLLYEVAASLMRLPLVVVLAVVHHLVDFFQAGNDLGLFLLELLLRLLHDSTTVVLVLAALLVFLDLALSSWYFGWVCDFDIV